uniref:Uncharacterized protein n=1 Tax=Panagrolaimus davidi TaxID=227884 RepID=A0A914Q4E6_9BILA
MYLQDISFPKVAAYLLRQHLSQNIDTLLIDFRQSKTPSIDDVFTTFSLDCEERSHQYTSFTTIVSNFPQKEIIDTLVKKLRQYVSKKLIILVDEKPYDSYLRLLKTRQFVVAGFATYFAAKEEFIIFKYASNDGDLCIGLRAPKKCNK